MGTWHDGENWSLEHPPTSSERAWIPGGGVGTRKWCIIYQNDAVCRELQIDGDSFGNGILEIKGKKLTLGDSAEDTTSTVDGKLRFIRVKQEEDYVDAVVAVHKTVTFAETGSGDDPVLDGSVETGSDYGGKITRASAGGGIKLTNSITVRGSLTFLADVDHQSANYIGVAHSGDTMQFGPPASEEYAFALPEISSDTGSRLIDVSAGLIQFHQVTFGETAPRWNAHNNGTIEVTDNKNSRLWVNVPFSVELSQNGTLDLKHDFRCNGQLTLTFAKQGPKIRVKSGKLAQFIPPEEQ